MLISHQSRTKGYSNELFSVQEILQFKLKFNIMSSKIYQQRKQEVSLNPLLIFVELLYFLFLRHRIYYFDIEKFISTPVMFYLFIYSFLHCTSSYVFVLFFCFLDYYRYNATGICVCFHFYFNSAIFAFSLTILRRKNILNITKWAVFC